MTRQEHLLTILSEECNEVGQRVSKALRFGLTEVEPGYEFKMNNAERILQEYCDLMAVVHMLRDENILPDWSLSKMSQMMEMKQMKVEKYLEHSKAQGTLQ